MTQRQLADLTSVGVPHISKVEAGRENPSDELIREIAKVFGIDSDELLLVARRLPQHMVEDLAANPAEGLEFLRTFQPGSSTKRSKRGK
jgi:transcriptional regulator with XRE-family HTH domain